MTKVPPPGVADKTTTGSVSLTLGQLDELFEARALAPLDGRFEERSGFDTLLDLVDPTTDPLQIEITIADAPLPHRSEQEVAHALSGYATARISRIDTERARIRRLGLKELAFGLTFLALCLVVSSALAAFSVGPTWFHTFVSEGLVIVGWISLWHPVDMLFFERLPLIRDQRVLDRIRTAQVRLHTSES